MTQTSQKLFEFNVVVETVICDQGPRNLGLPSALDIDKNKPFFKLPGIDHKIYFIFDPPHLIKSIRNYLAEKQLSYRGGVADWDVIMKIYNLNQTTPCHLIPNINMNHFELNTLSKMKGSLAVQIFSTSMYIAHSVYNTFRPDIIPENDKTGELIIGMDTIFNTLNCELTKTNIDKKLNYAISKDSEHEKFINEIIPVLESAKFRVLTRKTSTLLIIQKDLQFHRVYLA